MDLERIASIAVNYGLVGVMAIGLMVFCWVFGKRGLDENAKREERYHQLVSVEFVKIGIQFSLLREAIEKSDRNAEEARARIFQADQYQRDEHKAIVDHISILTNGSAESVKLLAEINGALRNLCRHEK